MRKYLVAALLLTLLSSKLLLAGNRSTTSLNPSPIPFQLNSTAANHWVDSVMATMTLDEKIAQLFMVAGYSAKSQDNSAEVLQLIKKYGIGGVIFFQGGPKAQINITNRLQKASKIPLLIGMDAEWGPSMRLDSTIRYPRQMMLGALHNDSLIYFMAKDIARQLRCLGVQIDFAPVADVNSNPNNPVINTRSFGENKLLDSKKAIAYMHGLQDNGVLACAKHFPGHGDTDQDSHETLPTVPFPKSRLDTLELYPFKQLFDAGVASVMVAHLKVPALEDGRKVPTSLSHQVVTDLLQDSLGFKGIIFTDALNMKGVSDYRKPRRVNVMALEAGNDVLLFPSEIPESIAKIKRFVNRGRIPLADLEAKCRKVLAAKYYTGLSKFTPIDTTNIVGNLNTPESELLKRRISKESVTVVSNENNFIPIQRLDTLSIAYLEIDPGMGSSFLNMLQNYTHITPFSIARDSYQGRIDSIRQQLKRFNTIIVGYHNMDARPQFNFGIRPEMVNLIEDLSANQKVVLCLFGSPYALMKFPETSLPNTIVIGYDNSNEIQDMAAQVLMGGIGSQGKLPVSAGKLFPSGLGITTKGGVRVSYVLPEEAGISAAALQRVDSIANLAITAGATPGCQIYAAVNGKVFLNKGYGRQTYSSSDTPITPNTLYDIASVTKVVATLPVIMRLEEQGKLSLTDSLGKFVSLAPNNTKNKILLWQLLTHQAGLKEYVPYQLDYLTAMRPGDSVFSQAISDTFAIKVGQSKYLNLYSQLNPTLFSHYFSPQFPIPIAQNLFSVDGLKDSIYRKIDNCPTFNDNQYRYSDHGFIYLQRIAENITMQSLDNLASQFFYKPLGMDYTSYCPGKKYPLDSIAPTEYDLIYRKQIVRGFVHDPTASLLGGISGNAGIFSNANDLGKILQAFLTNGNYGMQQLLDSATISLFTAQYSVGNRRGLGWDKPETDTSKANPVGPTPSPQSYGHSGFTGTLVWVDPVTKLVYVFLSNRVYPDAENTKLAKMNIRTDILEELEKAVKK